MLFSIEWNIILMFCMFSRCDLIQQFIYHRIVDNGINDAFRMFFMYLHIEDVIRIDLDNRSSCAETETAGNICMNSVLQTSLGNDFIQFIDQFQRFLGCTTCTGTDGNHPLCIRIIINLIINKSPDSFIHVQKILSGCQFLTHTAALSLFI